LVFVALLAGTVCAQSSSPSPLTLQTSPTTRPANADADVANLRERVAELERENALLRKLVLTFGEDRRFDRPTSAPYDNLAPLSTDRLRSLEMPPGSTPFQFNGVTYYIVPLTNAKQ
jgi:hypothetical protein